MSVRPESDRLEVDALVVEGLSDCAISRRTGIPRTTVRGWRLNDVRSRASCGRCHAAAHRFEDVPGPAYAYLLGQYLGDGYLAAHRRGVFCLRIYLDLLHLNVAETCRTAIMDVLPGTHVTFGAPSSSRMVIVRAYSKQWPCFFPQHGPGRKHDRSVELVTWQRTVVDRHPEQLVRGLIHSDGWRGTNNVVVAGKRYAYPRYQFSQVSDDIRRLFTDCLDQLGVRWRQMKPTEISIARRADVAALDRFVERKR